MPPERRAEVRAIGIEAVERTIDPYGRFIAAGEDPMVCTKYRNPFLRDLVWGILQSASQPGNDELFNLLVPPAIVTMDLFAKHQSRFNMRSRTMPGLPPHEIHDQYSPKERRIGLVTKEEWQGAKDSEGNDILIVYEADDTPSFVPIGVEVIVNAMSRHESPEKASALLNRWWAIIEESTIYDMTYSEGDDHLIHTVEHPWQKAPFRTWRDGVGAFRDRSGNLPKLPHTSFANNCFRIFGYEAEANLARMLGLDGWADLLTRKRALAIESLHEKFWMEGEQCFAMLVDGDGKQHDVVSNESALGLITGAVYPEYAKRAARRLLEDDLLTDFGTRVTSIDVPRHWKDEYEGYQREAVWPHMDTSFALGCARYGLEGIKQVITQRTSNLALEFGALEVLPVSRDGIPGVYMERGKPVASHYQGFVAHGFLGITTPEVSYPSSPDLIDQRALVMVA